MSEAVARAPASPTSTRALPLVVDLDGTLILTDTAFELIAANVARNPAAVASAMVAGLTSRAAMKRQLAATDAIDAETLPLRDDLVAWLCEQKKAGREIHLVSAADQAVVDQVASSLGLFD